MKRSPVLLAAGALLAASPALATQSLECRSSSRRGFEMFVSVGSGGGVDFVRITDGQRTETATGLPDANPRLAHGSLDRTGRLILHMVGADGRTPIASLDAPGYAGLLHYRGRTLRIRCRWERQD